MFFKKKEAPNPQFEGLTAAAQKVIQDSGLIKQRARVALVLDMSAGMEAVFQSGTAEKVCQRLLALAVHFDDNGAIDVFVCGEKRECLGELTPDNFAGYIDNEIRAKYKATGDASFGSMVEQVIKKYTTEKGDPAFVMFLTSGAIKDKERVKKLLIDSSTYPIFWQFIGIGEIDFQYMKELDHMTGRIIDNANFFQLNDIDRLSDDQLFHRLLNEFPAWLQELRKMGIIK